MGEIREPIKKTSIEKKKRITEKGFELICKQGYHNVTCVDIAKYANVSTGIIYQYFKDKKAIFLEGVKTYCDSFLTPLLDILSSEHNGKWDLPLIIDEIIESFINTHTISKAAHEELIAMSHIDDDVFNIFNQAHLKIGFKIIELLEHNGFKIDNINEKVHIIIGLVDNLCHEIVYHKPENVDYEVMKKETSKLILSLLK